jgi:hypothetical protein
MSLLTGLSLNDPKQQLSQLFEQELDGALELLSEGSKNSEQIKIVQSYLTSQFEAIQKMVDAFQAIDNTDDTSKLFEVISVHLSMLYKQNVAPASAPSTNIIIDATKKILTKCKSKKKVEKEPKAKKTDRKSKKAVLQEQVPPITRLSYSNVFKHVTKEDDTTEKSKEPDVTESRSEIEDPVNDLSGDIEEYYPDANHDDSKEEENDY